MWGLFKKIVIADRLALYVDSVYNNTTQHNGNTFILATVFFAFQIYCDFSGYSDIAIGAAKIMGFKLMTNFNRPYFSVSISEFWKRWHISLSTWFRDYFYISLGGNRVSIPRWYLNLFLVFLISGLWHGANWTFIIWGSINGFYLVFSIISNKTRTKIHKFVGLYRVPGFHKFINIFITFILACLAWVFFRANNLSDAVIILKKIFSFNGAVYYDKADPSQIIYSFLVICLLILIESKLEFYKGTFSFFNNKSWIIRNLSYAFIFILILLIGVFDGGQFIYFQF